MKRILLLTVAIAIAGCDSGSSFLGISGDFGGKGCAYDKLSFKQDGTVYMTMMGVEQAAQYKLDGEKVVLTPMGLVFTKKGDALEMGQGMTHMKCVKISGQKVEGTYSYEAGGKKLLMTFESGGNVRVSGEGGEKLNIEAKFEVNGNKVKIIGPDGKPEFITLNEDGSLEMPQGIRLTKK